MSWRRRFQPWSLKVQLASLTGTNRGQYHSGPLESAGSLEEQAPANFGSQSVLLLAWSTYSSLDSLALSVMFVRGFGTGGSTLWGTGLIADDKLGYCCYTSHTGQAEAAIWNMVRGLYPNHRNGERHTAWTFYPCREKPGTCHTTKMGSPTLVLITHLAAEIILIAFLNQGCERPSSGFKCHITANVTECIRCIYVHSWHINIWTNTMYIWDDNTLSPGQQPAEDC